MPQWMNMPKRASLNQAIFWALSGEEEGEAEADEDDEVGSAARTAVERAGQTTASKTVTTAATTVIPREPGRPRDLGPAVRARTAGGLSFERRPPRGDPSGAPFGMTVLVVSAFKF